MCNCERNSRKTVRDSRWRPPSARLLPKQTSLLVHKNLVVSFYFSSSDVSTFGPETGLHHQTTRTTWNIISTSVFYRVCIMSTVDTVGVKTDQASSTSSNKILRQSSSSSSGTPTTIHISCNHRVVQKGATHAASKCSDCLLLTVSFRLYIGQTFTAETPSGVSSSVSPSVGSSRTVSSPPQNLAGC